MNSMTAQEMFKLLGFEFHVIQNNWCIDDDTFYEYTNSKNEEVTFDLTNHAYAISWDFENSFLDISIFLHQAIHQQMKELGWIDE